MIDDHADRSARFGVPVCPHAGGVGLCEYVIHLRSVRVCVTASDRSQAALYSLIDYIAISGTMERNVLEFVDHLHEHFLYPCSINKNGRYNVPSNAKEGYRWGFFPVRYSRAVWIADNYRIARSIEVHEASIAEYEYPNGSYWKSVKA